ncbi:MAG TPA: erythromycin esterase family protein [Chitinophagaceae bacterium]|nr:erythromycin esterase family protein [Chitinophagaceae bacterium]
MKKLIIFLTITAIDFSVYSQQATNLVPGFKNETFLAKDQKDIYKIKMNKGDFLEVDIVQKGVDLVIDVFDPKGHELKSFDAPNGTQGSELVKIEARSTGIFTLEVHPFNDPTGRSQSDFIKMLERNQGKYAINSVKILTAKEYRKIVNEENKETQKIIQWLTTNSITLNSVSAGSGFDDLLPLKEILKDVQYVGLGEATHGTSEFFKMKHRMLEFLVKELGFTVFAIEASYAGCKNINDYVLYGKGDAYTSLASQGFWTWDTEEIIDMIEWMRKYNQSVSDDKKVKFTGFDIQVNTKGGGIGKIKDYLQKVDTIRYNELNVFLDSIESRTNSPKKDSILNVYKNFLSFFVMSKGNYVQKSSVEEYESTLEYCRVLGQLVDVLFMNSNNPRRRERNWRDYYMASNFFDMVAHEKPGTKVVMWAHNGHVSHNAARSVNDGLRSIGSYLKEAYGQAYYAFGFAFNKGGFQAIEADSTGKSIGLQEFITNPAKEKSLDWYLAQTNKPLCIFNIRSNNLPVFMNNFVNTPLATRYFGSSADRKSIDQELNNTILNLDYDGMIFINETHRAHPTKTGMRK